MKTNLILLSALLGIVTACGQTLQGADDPDDNPHAEIKLSARQTEFVTVGNTFGFKFLQKVEAAAEKDYIISPLSMQFLLGMVLDGAKGQTADEITALLGYGAGEAAEVDEYCLTMMKQLPALDKKTKILLADAIYVDEGFDLLQSYKQKIAKYYDAEVSNLKFADTQGSAEIINKWCSDHTEGLITHILDETDPDMLCYLLNALYFKSDWALKFSGQRTASEPFTLASGAKKQTPMMKQNADFRYGEGTSFTALRMPYGNGAYSMTVLLPKTGKSTKDVAAELVSTDWSTLLRRFASYETDLWLPKFETKFGKQLNDILIDLGMAKAFDPTADFTAMSPDALCLSFVRQDAIIKVDETGTEAAAVSSAGVNKTTSVGPEKHVVFHADHPFLYIISEQSTGAILFAGRYGCNP